MARKTIEEEPEAQAGPEDPVKVQYVLRSKYVTALRKEALRRAMDSDGRPSASAVLEEILDAWMGKGRR